LPAKPMSRSGSSGVESVMSARSVLQVVAIVCHGICTKISS
jgi:hypothetical protein